ncbi:MAG TPA: hypothetical protein VFA67_05460 [Candidatus Sulfotelmatobacter sp.]|nr:hypothetical protein [Candidatus Sulfotelmatobacter sp.]
MAAPSAAPSQSSRGPVLLPPRRRRSRLWLWLLGIFLVLLTVALISIRIAISRAEPILRTRVVETLTTRFKSPVELAELHVSIMDGLRVQGKGLKIFGANDPNPWEAGVQPLLAIREFRFATPLRDLFREPMRVDTIFVDGLIMNIPPKNDRRQMSNMRRRGGKMSIAVTRFLCTDTTLVINTIKPGKAPLVFAISDLTLKDIGPSKPLQFDATLLNPKPVGNIQSTGLFGPLNESSPRDSAVAGTYSFTKADLGTLKGIAGILSSTGQYGGTLGRIEVNGQTDTPDFRVAISGHPVPLHTEFHAIVDGTDGDTYLDPVRARFLHSSFTAKGKVEHLSNAPGHDIELHVEMARAAIEDLLRLGVRTDPPLMSGAVAMTTEMSLQPGKGDISERLRLKGRFHVSDGHFSNDKLQKKIDDFSLRGMGEPKLIHQGPQIVVATDLQGTFTLNAGMLSFSFLHFEVPGTHADMTGRYSLDGNTFDFHGKLKMDAKLSQMTTGWKSLLLKPVDPFFHKNGAGTELPFKITGTRSEPHFGLDFGHDGEIPSDKSRR